MNKLKAYIEKTFPEVLKADTVKALGDRSKYIGASDIAGCLRKAYLSKTIGEVHSIKQLIIFERGHMAEDIVEKMLYGTPLKKQVEVKGATSTFYPINAHIDFVADFGTQKVVIEAKSVSFETEEPYESWILQVQLQMGLLQSQSNQSVRGHVIAVDVNTGWYDTFEVAPNKVLFDMALQRADTLAKALVNKECPSGEEQLYCSSCSFKGDCPAITRGVTEQLPENVQEVVTKIKSLSKAEKEMKLLKAQLKEFMEATEKTRIKSGDITVSIVNRKGKKSIDAKALKQELPDIYSQFEIDGAGYSYVKVA